MRKAPVSNSFQGPKQTSDSPGSSGPTELDGYALRFFALSAEELAEPPHVEASVADLTVVARNAVGPVRGQPQ